MNVLELSEQEINRRLNLQALKDMGIDPYPAAEYPTNAFSTDIIADFKDEELACQTVYYDVYVAKMQFYNVPEINEELVTKKMGLTMDALNKYDGEGIESKLRSHLKEKSE